MVDGLEKLPRGIRNKNPGNIKLGTDWDGLSKEQTDPVFCIFDEAVMGIRALMRILLVYRFHHKKATIDDIITRWAPPSENDTDAYIKFVKKRLKKDKITINDIGELTKAVIIKENKKSVADLYLVPNVFNVGIQLSKIQLPKGTTLEEALKKLNK